MDICSIIIYVILDEMVKSEKKSFFEVYLKFNHKIKTYVADLQISLNIFYTFCISLQKKIINKQKI
jgi:hypothetical protein